MSGAAQMEVLAHAKINLSLTVLAREASGWHQIESLFCALELADEITIAVADTDAITLDVVAPDDAPGAPPDLGPTEQNLAYRAALRFSEQVPSARATHVRLVKRIPHGAGLGGGSSDAAAVLHGLNDLHDRPLSLTQLLAIGAQLGSDVPFFLVRAPLALAWGRGGRLAPLPPLPSVPTLLAVPHDRVPTGDAYGALSHVRGADYQAAPAVLDTRLRGWVDVARLAVNDFEHVVFSRLPLQRDVRDTMARCGAVIARLTGTGSAVYGIFNDHATLEHAEAELQQHFPDLSLITTATLPVYST